jgi:hypothetical protein
VLTETKYVSPQVAHGTKCTYMHKLVASMRPIRVRYKVPNECHKQQQANGTMVFVPGERIRIVAGSYKKNKYGTYLRPCGITKACVKVEGDDRHSPRETTMVNKLEENCWCTSSCSSRQQGFPVQSDYNHQQRRL